MSSVVAEPYEPPRRADAAQKRRAGFPDFILTGIVQLVNGPRAIINDMLVGVGDSINGAIVHKIDKDSVILKKKDTEIKLGME